MVLTHIQFTLGETSAVLCFAKICKTCEATPVPHADGNEREIPWMLFSESAKNFQKNNFTWALFDLFSAQAKLHPGEPHQQFALVLRDNDLGSTEKFTAEHLLISWSQGAAAARWGGSRSRIQARRECHFLAPSSTRNAQQNWAILMPW